MSAKPETVIYLVRHGMHDWLRPGHNRLAGTIPGVGLNAQGETEAQRLAALLADEPLDWVVASPLQRTVETAAIIARGRGVQVAVDDRFIEWRFGSWEGMRIEEIRERYPEEWWIWREDPARLRRPGAETLEQVAERMETACREYAGRGGTGVLVSHQDPLAALICRLIGAPLERMRTLDIRTGSFSKFRRTSYGGVVESINAATALE